ncbi:MAG: SurA N-terminal domain-containing protein [Campylobacteraceae bacterium]
MLTWMQYHKKYLIITIWVSVIAFVGAGFVGWGSLDFSKKSSSIAKVGDRLVSVEDYQQSYQSTFNRINMENFGGQLTQEMAEQFGLRSLVVNNLINEALLYNFADSLGLSVVDSDVVDYLLNTPEFKNDKGVFDKELYLNILRQNRIEPSAYENSLKKQILLNRVISITYLPALPGEVDAIGAALLLKDRVSISRIAIDEKDIKITDEEAKTFWQGKQASYLTEKSYEFDKIFVPASTKELSEDDIKAHYEKTKYLYKDVDEKILDFEVAKPLIEKDLRLENANSDALTAFLNFKKGELNATSSVTIKESTPDYNVAEFQTVSVGDVLRPIKKDNGYEILKLTKINFPTPKSYEDSYKQVIAELKEQKRVQLLTQVAESRLSVFSGNDIGFITKNSKNIGTLSEQESTQLVQKIFGSKDKKGFMLTQKEAILYAITDQKFPSEEEIKENIDLLNYNVERIKNSEVLENLIIKLRAQYKIEQYI